MASNQSLTALVVLSANFYDTKLVLFQICKKVNDHKHRLSAHW